MSSLTPHTGSRLANRPVRTAGAVLLAAAAIIHIVLIPVYPLLVLDILFVLSAAGMLLGGLLLLVGAPTSGWILGGGTAVLTALGYVVRSTVGIPGVLSRAIPFLRPTIGPVSVLIELLAAGLAIWVLGPTRPTFTRAVAELRHLAPGHRRP
ncbi:MAG: hypothetical protein QOG14_3178 [Mycobacterium sp.]|jgi:hypothetical protein|nr:hypothetical protein [Mycobacterium sp.]